MVYDFAVNRMDPAHHSERSLFEETPPVSFRCAWIFHIYVARFIGYEFQIYVTKNEFKQPRCGNII